MNSQKPMTEEEIKKIANDIFNESIMNNLDSSIIFKYIKGLEKENQKYKEVFDKIRNHCEIEINAYNHYLKNHKSQKELCHKVAHQRILEILKEVK